MDAAQALVKATAAKRGRPRKNAALAGRFKAARQRQPSPDPHTDSNSDASDAEPLPPPPLAAAAAIGRRSSGAPGGRPKPKSYANHGDRELRSDWALDNQVRKFLDQLDSMFPSHEQFGQFAYALFSKERMQEELRQRGWPTRAEQAVCHGVKERLQEQREAHIHKETIGRVAHNAIMSAAASGVLAFVAGGGTREQLAAAIGVSRQALWLVERREEKAKMHGELLILDPARKLRKDAVSDATVAAIQGFWAKKTQASPDKKPWVTVTLEDGTEVKHGVHWQKEPTKEIYEMYLDDPPEGADQMVGLSTFTRLKPNFVRKSGFKGCLCPKCYSTRLMHAGYRELLIDAGAATNACDCSFCTFHKHRRAQFDADPKKNDFATVVYPPETPRRLADAMLCPKAPLRPDSGFKGTHYPTFDPTCMRQFLDKGRLRELSFLDSEDGANLGEKPRSRHAEVGAFARQNECRLGCCSPLRAPPDRERECCVGSSEGVSCHACGEAKFAFTPPPECKLAANGTTTYRRMSKVPRRSGKEGAEREEEVEETVPTPQFLTAFKAQFSVWLLHIYVADWQDAVAELLMETEKPGHAVIGQDFGMNYTCVAGNEIKGGFFEREQVSLHTFLTYSEWPSDWDKLSHPDKKERAKQMMQAMIFYSDDKHHDSTYVKHNHEELYRFLHKQRADLGLPALTAATLLSDGGPGHYKQCRNFYNMCLMAVEAASLDPTDLAGERRLPFRLAHEFLAPDHGKGQWDGITSSEKNLLMSAEKSGVLPLSNAERVVQHLSQEKYVKKKFDGFPKAPFKVRAGSHYSAEYTSRFLTKSADLELRRSEEGDVATVSGTRTHFSYIYDRPGNLRMRWLGCPCKKCQDNRHNECVQPDLCGMHVVKDVKMTDRRGVRAHEAKRRILVKDLAQNCRAGDIVAVYAGNNDEFGRDYWLARVHKSARGVTMDEGERTCTHTGEVFKGPRGDSPGELFLETVMYRCLTGNPVDDRLFVKEISGGSEAARQPFLTAAQLLRCRVATAAEWESWRIPATGDSDMSDADSDDDAPIGQRRFCDSWELPEAREAEIRRMIDSEFKDGLFEDSTDNPNRRWVLHADGSVQHVRHGEAEEQSDGEDAAMDAAQDGA